MRPLILPLASLLLAGCAVGPSYRRPTVATPAAFKEADGWKAAAPSDTTDRGAWWEAFHDPLLNDLEAQLNASNLTLQQAIATYEQTRQLARADRATLFPTVSASGSGTRAKASSGRSSVSSGGSGTSSAGSGTGSTSGTGTGVSTGGSTVVIASGAPTNAFSASLGATWSLDFWGRIRQQTASDIAAAQASAADLANARLSLQATLAQDYVLLRTADERVRLRNHAVEAYGRTLTIAKNKYNVGLVARNDVSAAQAQLDAARAQALDATIQRAQLEHAIAVLVGKAPGDFSIAPVPALALAVPAIPAQLPSALLERRPDVAAAERNVAAANARVGVQTAAYFPTVTLTADGGFQGSELNRLFRVPNRFWSVGANLGETILDFGRRRAELKSAEANYDAAVANYRHTVLTAFQQVEDNLIGLRVLDQETELEQAAVNEAADAARIALNEYNAGVVDFTTVATAQVNELNNRQTALGIQQNRLAAAVALIEALGGGWSTADLPTAHNVLARRANP